MRFNKYKHTTTGILNYDHSNLWGPICVAIHGGAKYFFDNDCVRPPIIHTYERKGKEGKEGQKGMSVWGPCLGSGIVPQRVCMVVCVGVYETHAESIRIETLKIF